MLTYELHADLARLLIPAPQPSAAADALWQHTCFEFFAAYDGAPGYHEYNFSPSGQWAAYAFADYRQRESAVVLPPPRTHLERHHDRLVLDVILPPAALPMRSAGSAAGLRVGLSAVVETEDGQCSYWALRHPVGRPDFHHRDAFALSLDVVS